MLQNRRRSKYLRLRRFDTASKETQMLPAAPLRQAKGWTQNPPIPEEPSRATHPAMHRPNRRSRASRPPPGSNERSWTAPFPQKKTEPVARRNRAEDVRAGMETPQAAKDRPQWLPRNTS